MEEGDEVLGQVGRGENDAGGNAHHAIEAHLYLDLTGTLAELVRNAHSDIVLVEDIDLKMDMVGGVGDGLAEPGEKTIAIDQKPQLIEGENLPIRRNPEKSQLIGGIGPGGRRPESCPRSCSHP